jgi:hypothetical protein
MAGTPIYPRNPSNDNLLNGFKNVAVAGVAEALSADPSPCYEVIIQAKSTNAGTVYIGGPGLSNDENGGLFLSAGQSVTLTPQSLSQIFVDAQANGEGVTFIYWQ